MRRVKGGKSALAAVAGLAVLTVCAAVFSQLTSPLIPDYSSLPANDSSAQAALVDAVDATLSLRSFTVTVDQTILGAGTPEPPNSLDYESIYQAPNRSETKLPGETVIVVGSTRYARGPQGRQKSVSVSCPVGVGPGSPLCTTKTSTTQPPQTWIETSIANEPVLGIDGSGATAWLLLLQRAQSVQRSGRIYSAEVVGIANTQVGPQKFGIVSSKTTLSATVLNGRVIAEVLRTATTGARVSNFTETLRYGALDSSPAVDTPPRDDVIPQACFQRPSPETPHAGCWLGYAPEGSSTTTAP